MPTVLSELDDQILHRLENGTAVKTLDLMNELDPNYSESDVQRAVASLMSARRVSLTADRKLTARDVLRADEQQSGS